MTHHADHNRRAWDRRALLRLDHTRTASPADLANPMPALDPEGWLGPSIHGKSVLCLAAGGGLQSILCAAAGAVVTVADISPQMLALDRKVAAQLGLTVTTLETSMTDLTPLPTASFDLILQPVSSCYIPDLTPLYSEAARVLRPGALYISQHKQPASLQASATTTHPHLYSILEPYHLTGPLPPAIPGLHHREADTLEYLHTWSNLLGLLCSSGFSMENLSEPGPSSITAPPGSPLHRNAYLPPYVKICARRNPTTPPKNQPRLILPS